MDIITRKEAKEQGLKRYFTGKPCPQGHVAERRVSSGFCAECNRKNKEKYRKENRDKIRADNKNHYEENRYKILNRKAEYRAENPEILRGRVSKWRSENPGKVREGAKKWRRKAYAERPDHRLNYFMQKSLRRALNGADKKGRTHELLGYTPDELRDHIERQFTRGMSWDKMGSEIHIDHIVPVSVLIAQGETDPAVINALSNLRPLWASENMSKGARVETLL